MTGPHHDQPTITAGASLDEASAAVVAVHGRGATARSIVDVADVVSPGGVAILAPQAANNTWYPESFLAAVEHNEPGRSSGLGAIGDAVDRVTEAGLPADRVVILGFSQGGCLASEYVARNPRRYGAVVAFSGGLIGETVEADEYSGVLAGTPVFLGCSDSDPHIPEVRVHETAAVFEELDASVEKRLYPGMGHGVNDDEIEYVSRLVEKIAG